MAVEYSIGEFANLVGVTEQTLRNWDKTGKLVPNRGVDGMGHRRYTQKHLDSLLGTHAPIVEESLVVYGYAKMDENGTPQEYNNVIKPLREYLKTKHDSDEVNLLTDMYRKNNRTVDLHNFNTLLSLVQRHKVNIIVFSCNDSTDYYEYKSVSAMLYKLGVEIMILKNGINVTENLENIATRDSLIESINNGVFSRSDMFSIITELETKLDSTEEVNVQEMD